MHYLIDGYNLIFRSLNNDADLQSQREAIIEDLNLKASQLNLNFTIAFDSTQMDVRTRSHYNAVEIIFTAKGETADEYILEVIKHASSPRQKIVVTSDKGLARQARDLSAHTLTIEEFIGWLNRSSSKKNTLPRRKHKPKPAPLLETELPSDPPLESYTDYYEQIFETEFNEILVREKSSKPPPRKPKRKPKIRDPFQTDSPPDTTGLTEMERWLKLFKEKENQ